MNRYMKLVLVVASCLVSACGTLGPKLGSTVADQIDLGDGKVFGIVPISTAASAANKASPGSGVAIEMLGAHFAKQREAKYGPFNGLSYTTERQVILLSGKVIPQAEIDRIVEILTPIVPRQIVRVVEPQRVAFEVPPVTTNTSTGVVTPTQPTTGDDVVSPEDAAALEDLNSKD